MPDHPLLDSAHQWRRVVVMIESLGRIRERHYHKQKVTLILSAMRHYADALRRAGWRVDYREEASFGAGLQAHLREMGSRKLCMMEAAEWRARQRQHQFKDAFDATVEIISNAHFLREQFAPGEKPGNTLVLEVFYRAMRKHFGVLLEANGDPIGGAWNFDRDNRKSYNIKIRPKPPIQFAPDAITEAVIAKVEREAKNNIGSTRGFALAVTREQALQTLDDFIANRLPEFKAYEDAMAAREPVMFHSVLSPLMNIGCSNRWRWCDAPKGPITRAPRRSIRSKDLSGRSLVGANTCIGAITG